MSPRSIRPRKISDPPIVSGMRPYGSKLPPGKPPAVFLALEEYEAMRLCDHEGFNHNEAAHSMNVSRPTFTRIYSSARKKIASALVEGQQLVIEGGKIYFDNDWYNCLNCSCYFNHPEKHLEVSKCALCGSNEIIRCESYPEIIIQNESSSNK